MRHAVELVNPRPSQAAHACSHRALDFSGQHYQAPYCVAGPAHAPCYQDIHTVNDVRLPPARAEAWLAEAWLAEHLRAHCTGTEYEARLRQQHAKLNPRTGWATSAGAHRRRRRGFGGDSDSDEECAPAFCCEILQLQVHTGWICTMIVALQQTGYVEGVVATLPFTITVLRRCE